MNVGIVGLGGYLPETRVSNDDVEALSGYSREARGGHSLDEWVRGHHGGSTRYRAAPGQATSDLATEAAREAIADAGIDVGEVDLIVLATVTSDQRLPPSAAALQANLGSRAKYLQLDSACTGFLDCVQVAIGQMRGFGYRTALVVGADTTAFCIDPADWLTATVFGDGAGAAVLREVPEGWGFRSLVTGSDGHLGHYVCIPGGGSRLPRADQYLHARYKDVHVWAVRRLVRATQSAMEEAGIELKDVAWLVPHQASTAILRDSARRIGLPEEQVIVTYPLYGNTVASSLPLALRWARCEGRLEHGQWLVMAAVGAGMAWAAAAYRWLDPATIS